MSVPECGYHFIAHCSLYTSPLFNSFSLHFVNQTTCGASCFAIETRVGSKVSTTYARIVELVSKVAR